jgi:hypothetical protein
LWKSGKALEELVCKMLEKLKSANRKHKRRKLNQDSAEEGKKETRERVWEKQMIGGRIRRRRRRRRKRR